MKNNVSNLSNNSEEENSEGKLEDLIIKEKDISKKVLHDVLKDYVRFTEKGNLMLQESCNTLSIKDRVLLVLLAAKAMAILGLRNEETMRPKEIAKILGAKDGTIRGLLSDLAREGFTLSVEQGLWTINWSKLEEISKRFKKDETKLQ
jgi:hypothetical protein